MQVENHIVFLHLREDGVESCVVYDAGGGVGRYPCGIRFYVCDSCGGGRGDGGGCDFWVEVQGHYVGDVWGEGLEALLVGKGGGDGGNWWDEVWLLEERLTCY